MSEPIETREGKIQVATVVDQRVYTELAALADQNERSLAAELRRAIRNHLAKQDTA